MSFVKPEILLESPVTRAVTFPWSKALFQPCYDVRTMIICLFPLKLKKQGNLKYKIILFIDIIYLLLNAYYSEKLDKDSRKP